MRARGSVGGCAYECTRVRVLAVYTTSVCFAYGACDHSIAHTARPSPRLPRYLDLHRHAPTHHRSLALSSMPPHFLLHTTTQCPTRRRRATITPHLVARPGVAGIRLLAKRLHVLQLALPPLAFRETTLYHNIFAVGRGVNGSC